MLKNHKILHFLTGLVIVLFVWFFLLELFPNHQGALGHDYSNFLSILLEGRIWFDKHGWSVEWFTPAFGAGLPKFPDPQNMQYSIPQLIANYTSPMTALRITFFTLLSVGYLFCYKACLTLFKQPSPLLGHLCAALFIANSFFLTRMMVGHLTYHTFMLLPLSFYLFLQSIQSKAYVFPLSLSLGYLFYGGAGNYVPMYFVSLVLLASMSILYLKVSWTHLLKLIYAFILSLVIGFPQILSTLAFLKHFPRDHIANPMYQSGWDSLFYNLKMLFWGPIRTIHALPHQIKSPSFLLEQHELEFSAGLIPLFLIMSAISMYIVSRNYRQKIQEHSLHISAGLLGLSFIIFSILMWSNPFSNWAMKSLPYLKNLSSLLRGLSIFIFPIIVFSIMVFKQMNLRWMFLPQALIILSLVSSFILWEGDFYHHQTVKSEVIDIGYDRYISGQWEPTINGVSGGQGVTNQHFVFNKSSMYPYQPIFGYRLETYPGQKLLISSPLTVTPGVGHNFLNPSCLVFPEINGCKPGDHFQDVNQLKNFLNYGQLEFKTPTYITLSFWALWISVGLGIMWTLTEAFPKKPKSIRE